METGAITLSQLQQILQQAVSASPAGRGLWVTAELSDVRQSGGHCYMELIEKDDQGRTTAKLRAAIWANRLNYLRQKFYAATGRDITTGIKVMLAGATTHHSVYGLSFIVNDIDPSYTMGDMERLRREILDKLTREGVIGFNRSLPLPAAPQKIAIISSPGAAGWGDFINQINDNADGIAFYPKLFPATMQGNSTSASVRAALAKIEETIDLWDCVAIVRGGGATTDLNGFDDYELARAVATFPLPIVVGIGHERDRTVLDEIARVRLKTPTAVAAFFVDQARGTYSRIAELAQNIVRYTTDRLRGEERRLATAASSIPALVNLRMSNAQTRLDGITRSLPGIAGARIAGANAQLTGKLQLLSTIASQRLTREQQRLDADARLLAALDPINTLKRGYSVTRVDGHAVKDASAVPPGTVLTTTLASGTLTSTTT